MQIETDQVITFRAAMAGVGMAHLVPPTHTNAETPVYRKSSRAVACQSDGRLFYTVGAHPVLFEWPVVREDRGRHYTTTGRMVVALETKGNSTHILIFRN